jgi:hypothetical protein
MRRLVLLLTLALLVATTGRADDRETEHQQELLRAAAQRDSESVQQKLADLQRQIDALQAQSAAQGQAGPPGPPGPPGPAGASGGSGSGGAGIAFASLDHLAVAANTNTRMLTLNMTAPTAGYVAFTLNGTGTVCNGFYRAGLNPTDTPNAFYSPADDLAAGRKFGWTSFASTADSSGELIFVPFTTTNVVKVDAGPLTISGDVYIDVDPDGPPCSDRVQVFGVRLTGIFVPTLY